MSTAIDLARKYLARLPPGAVEGDAELHEAIAHLSGVLAALDGRAPASVRLAAAGDRHDEEVIGELFGIDGVADQFAVHACITADHWLGKWTATHVETGFAVGRGDTIDGAISAARTRWLAMPADVIETARARAKAFRAGRDAQAAAVPTGGAA